MRYFTRGWACGDLTDAEWKHALAAYRARIAEIAPQLPRGMLRLTRDVSLHDGFIEQIVWNPTKSRLRLSLVCGNVGSGYYLVQLTYDGAMLGSARIESLKRAASSRDPEVLYDEVDVAEEGHLCHRILFNPSEEVTLEFERFRMTVSARPDRRVEWRSPFVEEQRRARRRARTRRRPGVAG